MDSRDLLADAASRVTEAAGPVLEGLGGDVAHAMPQGANSIAWLLWHAARQMDVQTVALSAGRSVWATGGWSARLGVERGEDDFGFGDSAGDVAALRVRDVPALGDHVQECVDALTEYVRTLSDADLDEVIDASYTPAVTRGTRIVSIIDDAVTHVGQAAYARGIVDGWSYGV